MKTLVKGGWLTLNRVCNNRCDWCYAKPTGFSKPSMDKQLAERLIDFFGDLKIKTLILIGGEPTLYPNLSKIVEHVVSRGIKPVLVTNGIRFKNRGFAEELFSSGLRDVTLSVKGLNSYEYEKATKNKNGFIDMMAGLYTLEELGYNVNLSFTITERVASDIDRFASAVLGLGFSNISFDLASPIVGRDEVSIVDIPSPKKLAEAVMYLHQRFKGRGLNYGFYLSIPLCLIDEGIRTDLIDQGVIVTTCHIYKGTGLIFDTEGNVLPCNHFVDFSLGKYGIDFSDVQSFKEFWESTGMIESRHSLIKYPTQKCSTCEDWSNCGGGCVVKWLHWKPEEFII